jgi:hypothetical protein
MVNTRGGRSSPPRGGGGNNDPDPAVQGTTPTGTTQPTETVAATTGGPMVTNTQPF